jgi:hypothetical protein
MPIGYGGVYATENPSVPMLGAMGNLDPDHQSSGGGGRASGVGNLTQTNTAGLMTRVQEFIENWSLSNWLPFTWGSMARFVPPRAPTVPFGSPYDLTVAGITRFGSFPSSERPFPYPWMTGAVSGFCPLMDDYSRDFSWSKQAFGPSVGTPMQIPWQITYPTMQKQTG